MDAEKLNIQYENLYQTVQKQKPFPHIAFISIFKNEQKHFPRNIFPSVIKLT